MDKKRRKQNQRRDLEMREYRSRGNSRGSGNQIKRRRKKRKRRNRLIPALIAIVLILLIGGLSVAALMYEKYSYSKEEMDIEEYFDASNDGSVILFLGNERLKAVGRYQDGAYYLPYSWVKKNLNGRFYVDEVEGLLLYPLPDEVVTMKLGASSYTTAEGEVDLGHPLSQDFDGEMYLLIDYVKKLSNFNYQIFEEPRRIQLYIDTVTYTYADVIKKSAVRFQGGVKSEILKKVEPGEKLQVGEEFENWVEVRTEDTITGYIEKKHLSEFYEDSIEACTDVVDPIYTNLVRDHKINMVWHQMVYKEGNSTLDKMTEGMTGVNVISPTWFFVSDEAGNIEDISSVDYVEKAHAKGLEVWALADNFTHDIDSTKLLSRTSTRQNLVANLIEAAVAVGVDGINVDFEDLNSDCGAHFVEFIRELSIQCRKNDLVLSVDNYVPLGNTSFYGRQAQGEACDYIIIMGYDEHWGSSEEAGSVASLGFVELGITETLKEVPAEKIINAVPLYTRLWKTENGKVSSEIYGMANAKSMVKEKGIDLVWDDETCQNYGAKESGDALYQIWMEDEESIRAKISVMKSANLGGVAAWKLGLETDDIWDVLKSFSE